MNYTKPAPLFCQWLRDYAPTQPNIIACDKILRLCDRYEGALGVLQQVDDFFAAQGKHINDYCGSVHTHPIVKAELAKARGE